MSFYKRGKSWYIDIALGGHRINRKVADRKKDAIDIEAELKTKFRLGHLSIEELTQEKLFSTAAAEYLQHVKDVKSERTYALEAGDWENHLKKFWQNRIIPGGIDNEVLIKFQGRQKKKGLSNRTVNIHVGLVRKILYHPSTKKLIKNLDLKFPMLREAKKKHAFLSPDEYHLLLRNFDPKGRVALDKAIFGRHTGLRPKELTFLSWDDVIFPLRNVRIRSKPEHGFVIKDDEERDVPLDDIALALLEKLIKERAELPVHEQGPWIFSQNGKQVGDIGRALDTAARKAKLGKKVTPNMFRHSFATHFLMSGGDVSSLQKILGHSSLETTQRYVGVVEEHMRSQMNNLTSLDANFTEEQGGKKKVPTKSRQQKKEGSRKIP